MSIISLSGGIKDATVQQAVRQLEQQINRLTRQPVVTGSKGGNAALASLITALAELGLIADRTT